MTPCPGGTAKVGWLVSLNPQARSACISARRVIMPSVHRGFAGVKWSWKRAWRLGFWVWVVGFWGAAQAAPAVTPPNILLLVAEDLSPRIGAYGDTLARTPHLDQLAARGTRYTRVFTTAGVCAPSRAALLTGQHQIAFGGQHMRASTGPLGLYYAQPSAQVRAFPELLRAHGYFTFTDAKLDYQFSGVRSGSGPFTIWDVEGATDDGWRQRAPGQPFFGLINFLETHESGVMHPHRSPYSQTHAMMQKMRQGMTARAQGATDPAQVVLPPYYPDLPEVRQDVARHYDNIQLMDQRVGRILAMLQEDDLTRETLIIWTTDHGDGLPRAKRELFDSGVHVPLLVSAPGQSRVDQSVDSQLVSFVDLAPTILEWAGIALPDWLHGRSLQSTSVRDYVFASRDRIDEVRDRQRSIRDHRFKLIRSWHPQVAGGHELAYRDNLDMVRAWRKAYQQGRLTPIQSRWFEPVGPVQLYDLVNDPHELHNLADSPEHTLVLERLSRALQAHLERVGDLSETSETDMRQSFLVAGKVPVTPPPRVLHQEGKVHLSSPIGASIGYRLSAQAPWKLYTTPVVATQLEAKSVRYGYRESSVVSYPSQ